MPKMDVLLSRGLSTKDLVMAKEPLHGAAKGAWKLITNPELHEIYEVRRDEQSAMSEAGRLRLAVVGE